MDSDQKQTLADYKRKGFVGRAGYGSHPALLIVDFIKGFTDPGTALGGDFDAEVAVTQRLQQRFHAAGLPVVLTTTAYKDDLSDGATFVKKVPALALLKFGSPMIEIDPRLAPGPDDHVVTKKFASAFFGTDADSYMKGKGVDTVIVTGCTTSGCIRASALDAMQSGYHTIVVSDAVGDRAAGPHAANLFDLDAKYADVVGSDDVFAYLDSLAPTARRTA